MVFEQIFSVRWIERKPWFAFMMGMVYSLIGIVTGRLVFRSSAGIAGMFLTSILMVLSVNKLFADEENLEIREKKFSFYQLLLDHWDIFVIYFFLFMGVFCTYGFIALLDLNVMFAKILMFAIVLLVLSYTVMKSSMQPNQKILLFGCSIIFALIVVKVVTTTPAGLLFKSQFKAAGITGYAIKGGSLEFQKIVWNNLIVMLVCLLTSLIYGAGSIMFIVWNASVWGAVFGFVARESMMSSYNPLIYFAVFMSPIIPHMVTEALSYFSAAIVGGVVSKGVIREKMFSEKFYHIVTDGVIMAVIAFIIVLIAGWIEVYAYPVAHKYTIAMVIIIALICAYFHHLHFKPMLDTVGRSRK